MDPSTDRRGSSGMPSRQVRERTWVDSNHRSIPPPAHRVQCGERDSNPQCLLGRQECCRSHHHRIALLPGEDSNLDERIQSPPSFR